MLGIALTALVRCTVWQELAEALVLLYFRQCGFIKQVFSALLFQSCFGHVLVADDASLRLRARQSLQVGSATLSFLTRS